MQCKGPDDKLYDKKPDVRAKIARGNTILVHADENGEIKYDLVIYALRKFTGGMGDEDDLDRNAKDWKMYFLKDLNEAAYVCSLKKANGEAAHLACRWLNGQFVIFAGSKNVHLAFRNKSENHFFRKSPILTFK